MMVPKAIIFRKFSSKPHLTRVVTVMSLQYAHYDKARDIVKEQFKTDNVVIQQLLGSSKRNDRVDDATVTMVLDAADSQTFVPHRQVTTRMEDGKEVVFEIKPAYICSTCHGAGHLPINCEWRRIGGLNFIPRYDIGDSSTIPDAGSSINV